MAYELDLFTWAVRGTCIHVNNSWNINLRFSVKPTHPRVPKLHNHIPKGYMCGTSIKYSNTPSEFIHIAIGYIETLTGYTHTSPSPSLSLGISGQRCAHPHIQPSCPRDTPTPSQNFTINYFFSEKYRS